MSNTDRHSSIITFVSKIDQRSIVRVLQNKSNPMEKKRKKKSVNMPPEKRKPKRFTILSKDAENS